MYRNGLLDETNEKVESFYHLQEVDITRIPNNILAGLIPVVGEEGTLTAEEIRPEHAHEIWILQCPATAGLGQLLQGRKLYLDERKQIFDDGEKSYEAVCIPHRDADQYGDAAVVPDESGKMQLVSFPVSGHIMIKEVMQQISDVIPIPSPRKVHPLPSGLKIRHPIYGADYKIQDIAIPTKHKKKKRKTKEVDAESVLPRQFQKANEPIAEEPAPAKEKSRKRKATEIEAPNHVVPAVFDEEVPRKKSKRRHIEPGPEPVAVPIITIQEEPEKKKKRKSSVKIELDSEVEVASSRKHRKSEVDVEKEPEIELEVIKRKKKKSTGNEPFLQPEPVSPKKKRKKGSSYSE